MKDYLDLAIIGFGTVGQGLAEILVERGGRLDVPLRVVAIADLARGSVAALEGVDLGAALAAAKAGEPLDTLPGEHGLDALATIRSSPADAVVEATFTDIETGQPAIAHVEEALRRGRHVVTTNKGPVALAGRRLLALAAERGVSFRFEGTVMSGTPVLTFARRNLAGCEVRAVRGILNGTTNYILTEMERGESYASALAAAQKHGYAEAVPDADVEGHDAVAKVVILANLLFGAELRPADVECEGVTGITPDDIDKARAQGLRLKLIGSCARRGGAVVASVRPVALEAGDPLAGVGGATNAVTFETDLLGAVTVVGPGAGRLETGFALLSDLLEIGRARGPASSGSGPGSTRRPTSGR